MIIICVFINEYYSSVIITRLKTSCPVVYMNKSIILNNSIDTKWLSTLCHFERCVPCHHNIKCLSFHMVIGLHAIDFCAIVLYPVCGVNRHCWAEMVSYGPQFVAYKIHINENYIRTILAANFLYLKILSNLLLSVKYQWIFHYNTTISTSYFFDTTFNE